MTEFQLTHYRGARFVAASFRQDYLRTGSAEDKAIALFTKPIAVSEAPFVRLMVDNTGHAEVVNAHAEARFRRRESGGPKVAQRPIAEQRA